MGMPSSSELKKTNGRGTTAVQIDRIGDSFAEEREPFLAVLKEGANSG